VHSGSKLLGNSNYNVAEDNSALGIGVNLNVYDLLISYAEISCCFGSKVNVTLCSDNALSEFKLCTVVGVNELTSTGACYVTGLTNGSCNADRTSVGKGYFNLACGTGRTKDRSLDRALRAYNGKLLCTSVLTGLAEVLLLGELVALAKENVNCLTAEVDVSCRCFNDKFFIIFFNNLLKYTLIFSIFCATMYFREIWTVKSPKF
jgi:hypothetical protein